MCPPDPPVQNNPQQGTPPAAPDAEDGVPDAIPTEQPTPDPTTTTTSSVQVVSATPNGTVRCNVVEPLVDPAVEPVLQGTAPLNGTMRPALTNLDTWQASGCHPTSLLIVARWWARTNTSTAPNMALSTGHRQVRDLTHAGTSNFVTVATLARDLWGGWNPPVARTPAPTGIQVPYRPEQHQSGASATDEYTNATSWAVDHAYIQRSMRNLRLRSTTTNTPANTTPSQPATSTPSTESQPGTSPTETTTDTPTTPAEGSTTTPGASTATTPATPPAPLAMHTATINLRSRTQAQKIQAIQDALLTGPILANMTRPGHYVVVYGLRGGKIYIADPGLIIRRWARNSHAPEANAQCDGDGRVVLDVDYVFHFTGHDGPVNMTWLQSVILIEKYWFEGVLVSQAPCPTTSSTTTPTSEPTTTQPTTTPTTPTTPTPTTAPPGQ